MKICIFTHQYLPRIGGLQILVKNMIDYFLHETQNEVILIAPYYDKGSSYVEQKGRLKIYRVFNPDQKVSVFLSLWKIPKILRVEKPDLIHGHDVIIDGIFCYYFSFFYSCPIVLTTQGELNPLKRSPVPKHMIIRIPIIKRIIAKANAIIAPEKRIREKLEFYFGMKEKLHYIHNALYVSQKCKLQKDDDFMRLGEFGLESQRFFLFLGRIVKEKGVFEILESVNKKASTFRKNKFKFLFCGKGNACEELKKKSYDLNLDDLIFYNEMNLDENKWLFFRHTRALVLPSWEENQPLSILEAFAFACPVIGSNIPEIASLCHPTSVCSLHKLKSVESLSNIFEEAILTKSVAGPNDFEEAFSPYNFSKIGPKLLDLYHKLLL